VGADKFWIVDIGLQATVLRERWLKPTVKQHRKLVNNVLLEIWAYPNYHDSDIATIAITIVIYYHETSHYRYYHSALVHTWSSVTSKHYGAISFRQAKQPLKTTFSKKFCTCRLWRFSNDLILNPTMIPSTYMAIY